MKQLKKPSWRRQRAERQEGRSGARRDEAGAVLVLALLFVLVVSIVIGSIASWATNDLGNTTKFTNARTVQYSVSSTVNTAIGNIRYTPLFATQLLTTPTQPGYCWTPSSGSTSTLQINGVTTTVWCYTNYNAGSSSTRVVTFSACTTANESAASCAANPTLQAVVTFDDYPTGYSPPSTAQCAVYCGTGMTENSWTWFGSAVIPATRPRPRPQSRRRPPRRPRRFRRHHHDHDVAADDHDDHDVAAVEWCHGVTLELQLQLLRGPRDPGPDESLLNHRHDNHDQCGEDHRRVLQRHVQ